MGAVACAFRVGRARRSTPRCCSLALHARSQMNQQVSQLSLYDIAGTPGVGADVSHINTRAQVKVGARVLHNPVCADPVTTHCRVLMCDACVMSHCRASIRTAWLMRCVGAMLSSSPLVCPGARRVAQQAVRQTLYIIWFAWELTHAPHLFDACTTPGSLA